MAIAPHDLEEFDRNLPIVVEELVTEAQPQSSRGRKALRIVTRFLFGQGAIQFVGVLANLFLIRKLSIEAYAQFGLATGFQTVFTVLMDLGFASTIVPLVGERRDDRLLVGRYVRSARHLRNRTFTILSPVVILSFFAITYRHHWNVIVEILLVASVLVSLYSAGKASYFSAPLFVFGRLKEYYVPQIITGTTRLISYIALAFVGGLNAWTAAGLGAFAITANGRLIRTASQKYFDWPDRENSEVDREMIKFILPASPAIIFSAFQSQISLFLIGIFGGTIHIAEVTALSRIGQIFAVLMTFNTVVVEPYVARLSREKLLRTYAEFISLAFLAYIPLVSIAFLWPQIFVWMLGSKYDGVRDVMGWYILSSAIVSIASLMWIMNRARKWVFWSGSILEVSLLLAVQIIYLIVVGVRTTHEAVFFGLASSFCYLVAHGYAAVYGFWKNRITTSVSYKPS